MAETSLISDIAAQPVSGVRARLLFLFCLFAFAAGPLFFFAGILNSRGEYLAGGVLFFGVGLGVRRALRRRGEWASAEAAFDAIGKEPTSPIMVREEAFLLLLRQREALEAARFSRGFDPWALQAVRRELRAAIERDHALARIFRGYERRRRIE